MGDLINNLALLRAKRPLVHCITNQVTMHLVANALLALGASPIMSSSPDEVEEVTAQADALYINIGTLQSHNLPAMLAAGRVANQLGVPIVLDPVGAGFTIMRSKACAHLLNAIRITAIRANASEVLALSRGAGQDTGRNHSAAGRGVDSAHQVQEARVAADDTAREYGLLVALTGASDYITDGGRGQFIDGGHELMASVSGMGCAVSALLAAWLALPAPWFKSAAHALQLVGQCGLQAGLQVKGPGGFMGLWLDELYRAGR